MSKHEISRSLLTIATAVLVVGLGLIPSFTSRQEKCQIYSRSDGDAFYLDPAYNTRFRIKGDEVAVRLIGAFDTDQSAYKNLNPGQGVYIKAIRKIAAGMTPPSDHTVMEVVAANIGGKIRWTLGYRGDSDSAGNKVLLASDSRAPNGFECEIFPSSRSAALDLGQIQIPGVTFGPPQIIEIPSDSTVYSKLGL